VRQAGVGPRRIAQTGSGRQAAPAGPYAPVDPGFNIPGDPGVHIPELDGPFSPGQVKAGFGEMGGPDPYVDPTQQHDETEAKLLAQGMDPDTVAHVQAHNAKRYALMRLQQLAGSGLSDDQGDISAAAKLGAAGDDPAAAWRALSSRFMGAFQKSGGQGDPRAWLQQQVATRRAAALMAARARSRERHLGRAARMDAMMGG
jgi:hypothetical protein